MPIQNWSQALSQLDIYFEGRLDSVLEILINLRQKVVFNILCHSFKLNAKALRSDLCPNPLILIKP